MTKSVTMQMQAILEEYAADVQTVANEVVETVSKEAVQKLKSTSPKRNARGKHYATGWAMNVQRGPLGAKTVTVYNKTKPQMTHLLENGHVIANKYGQYGRTQPIKHIEPVEEWAATELEAQIVRKLE